MKIPFVQGAFYDHLHIPLAYCCMLFILLLPATACKKFLHTEPPKNQIISGTVYSSDITAVSAINGIYSQMIENGFASGDLSSIGLVTGLSADEFNNFSGNGDQSAFYTNSILPTNGILTNAIWNKAYTIIYYANSVIEGLDGPSGVSINVKNQLLGEAKFIRAFCHFYLFNLFGEIPLSTTTNYEINNRLFRASKADVYSLIESDLNDAKALLNDQYVLGLERIRPNRSSATALLARSHLYVEKWSEAENEATYVIGNTGQYALLNDLTSIFLMNSREAIWQLRPVVPGKNTNEASVYVITSSPGNAALTSQLIGDFETGDKRFTAWVGEISYGGVNYFFPAKYKSLAVSPLTEYSMVLRLAEQYLIRAEARAQQNNLIGALEDLNIIRKRAGLAPDSSGSKAAVLDAIYRERRIELFAEWGHRWFDVNRTNRSNTVFGAVKSSNWQSSDALYPLPQTDINNNKNLTQNPGY